MTRGNVRHLTVIILAICTFLWSQDLFAANKNWVQTDWSGDADNIIAHDPVDQIGWAKFSNKDFYIKTSFPGQISISPRPNSITQTGDVLDFERGVLSNSLRIVGSGYYTATRYEESHASVVKTGTWTNNGGGGPSGGNAIESNVAGSSVTFTFSGGQVSLIGLKFVSLGIIDVYLDDVFQESVDLYSSTLQAQQVLWSISGLSNTTHKVKIIVTNNRNSNSSGTYVSIDAFDVIVPNPDVNAYLTLIDGARTWTQTGDKYDFDRGVLTTSLRIVGSGYNATTRYEESHASVVKTGTWTNNGAGGPSGGNAIESNVAGSSVTFTFSGGQVSLIGLKFVSLGIIDVYLDDVFQESVDLYSSTLQSQQVLWSISGLSNTTHKVKVVVTNNRNSNSSGTYVSIDAFDVLVPNPDLNAYITFVNGGVNSFTQTADLIDFDRGALTNVKIVGLGNYATTRYEESHASVVKTGTWTDNGAGGPSGGNAIESNVAGSSVTFTFSGSKVSLIGLKYVSLGIAKVYLDDVFKANVDLYSSTLQAQQVLWSISGLPYATHKLKVVVTSNRNSNSSGTYVSIDAFDVEAPNPDNGAYLTLQNTAINGNYVSPSFDVGTGGGIFRTIAWNAVIPAGSALKFQIAANNDNLTWNFVGPDGSSNTFYVTSGEQIFSGHTGSRYIKYKAVFDRPTTDPLLNPVLNDITVSYSLVSMLQGTYESPSQDVGAGGGIFETIIWNAVVPTGSGLKFQIAANNDNLTWNFTGPDGTAGTYYTTTGGTIFSGINGRRYIKYKAFFNRPAIDPVYDPVLNDVTIRYGLMATLQGTYESPVFDVGAGGAFYNNLAWNAVIPAGSALKFQIATNNDNQTWNFVGPDGNSSTYYDSSGTAIFSGHTGHRYMKYKAYFVRPTVYPADSPKLNDVTVNYDTNPFSFQSLTSSTYDTSDNSNVINRLQWTEYGPAGTEVFVLLRTSSDGNIWGPWYGPHSTKFSSLSGVSTITVVSTIGFSAGSWVVLIDKINPGFIEIKKIVSVNPAASTVTFDSVTSNAYSADSTLTDTYSDPLGKTGINNIHKSGGDDRFFQYRAFLLTTSGTVSPLLLDIKIGYLSSLGIYQPDGIVGVNGDNVYRTAGTGTGGIATKNTDPGFTQQLPLTYDIRIQNDGSPESIDDTYTIHSNAPSDVSGNWSIYLNDGTQDLTFPVSLNLNAQSEKVYTLKVVPSLYAPGDSVKDIIMDIYSENDYSKVDSIKTVTQINRVFKADAMIDGNGNNRYDPSNTGGGGTSAIKPAIPGDTVLYNITVQNEGNMADGYRLSLLNTPPVGWTVLLNDGIKDYDITNTAIYYSTSLILSPPSSNTASYTLKIIPKGPPFTTDIVLKMYSNSAATYLDSVTAKIDLQPVYKVDGIIYGFAYNQAGDITDYGTGAGCGTSSAGDNIYSSLGAGGGGCTAVDIPGGSSRNITLAVQNEGNALDRYLIKWNLPPGWTIVLQEMLNDGSVLDYGTQAIDWYEMYLPTPAAGNPAGYIGGESPSFMFKVIPPLTFNSGFQTIIFDIKSVNNVNKVDSVKLVINSSDTTPPSSVVLTTGNITKTSVKVTWTAPGDDGGVTGTAASYDLRYSKTPVTSDAEFNAAVRVRGCKGGESNLNKPKAAGNGETCTVSPLFANTDYYFALKASDDAGNKSSLSTCSNCPARTLVSNDIVKPGTVTDLAVKDIIITRNPVTLKEVIQASLCWTAPLDDSGVLSSGSVTAYDIRYSTRRIIDDGSVISIGETTFSNAVSITPVDGYLPPNSYGMQECYMIPIENKIDLGGGIFDDRTRNTKFHFAIKGIDEAYNSSLMSNSVNRLTPLVPYTYNLVSVPYVPVPSGPKDVFGDDVGTPLYTYWWRSSGTAWDNGCYDGEPAPHSVTVPVNPCSKLTQIKEGLGYFLWAPPKDIAIDVPSGSTQSPVQTCGDGTIGTFNCYVMPLQEGTNIIGTVFDKEIYVTTRDINNNSQTEGNERGLYIRRVKGSITEIRTFQDAVNVSPAWIDGSVYTNNGYNYNYETCGTDAILQPLGSGCAIAIQPWKAYLIRMNISDPGSVFELLIPN